ncbi:MAG: hypothetical protein IJK26_09040 [Clostridia bacterium]|nr:hypothetical protein [Clostridia bacterium]
MKGQKKQNDLFNAMQEIRSELDGIGNKVDMLFEIAKAAFPEGYKKYMQDKECADEGKEQVQETHDND